jgi:hypothetical protein
VCSIRNFGASNLDHAFFNRKLTLGTTPSPTPEQIYNMDEMGLFWRCFPECIFVCSDEKEASGVKKVKGETDCFDEWQCCWHAQMQAHGNWEKCQT